MNKNHWIINTFMAVVCAIFLYNTSFAEPANLGKLRVEAIAYHDSGAYQQELDQSIDRANRYIASQVVLNNKRAHPLKLAVVLDIDETSLLNYDRLFARDFNGDRDRVHQDILAADAPAVKPMLTLYNDALKQGVAVFFVTGRDASEQQATYKNLKKAGYDNWSGVYFKPNHYKESSNAVFKTQARAAINKQGYTIIASIGDQDSDLRGGYAQNTFKLPNPYYYLP